MVGTTEVAAKAGISRQAAHKQLRLLVDRGVLVVEGKARAARYHRPLAQAKAQMAARLAALNEDKPSLPARQAHPQGWAKGVTQLAVRSAASTIRSLVDDTYRVDNGPELSAVVNDGKVPSISGSRVTVAVAPAGTLYRLSARMLLAEVDALEVVLDFARVTEVSDEYLEELFVRYPAAHPGVRMRVVRVNESIRSQVFDAMRTLT